MNTINKINNINELNSNILKSNIILISGRTGIGKSTFTLNYTDYLSNLINKKVLYFTLEMNLEQSKKCLDKVNYKNLYYTGVSELEVIDNISFFEVIINKIKEEKDLGLVIIDYLQLLDSVSENQVLNKEKIDSTINQLKKISNDLNLPIVLISHLPRFSNIEDESIPNPENLRLIDYTLFDLILMISKEEDNDNRNLLIYKNKDNLGIIALNEEILS